MKLVTNIQQKILLLRLVQHQIKNGKKQIDVDQIYLL